MPSAPTRSSSSSTRPGSRWRSELRERFGWRLVYDCMDEHTGFGTHGENTAADERRLIDRGRPRRRDLASAPREGAPDPLGRPRAAQRRRRRALRGAAGALLESALAPAAAGHRLLRRDRGVVRRRVGGRSLAPPSRVVVRAGRRRVGRLARSARGATQRAPLRRGAVRRAARVRRRFRRLHDPVRAHAADRGDQPGQALRVPRDGQAHRRAATAGNRAVRRGRRPLRTPGPTSRPRSKRRFARIRRRISPPAAARWPARTPGRCGTGR